MKKLLLASAAVLALPVGSALADVKVSGDGRMGVVSDTDYNAVGANTVATTRWNFNSRVRVRFDLSGESDSGLSFGGTIRVDNGVNGSNGGAGNVWISGAFGKLAFGDVVGAAEAVLFDLPEIGYTDLSTGLGIDNDVPFLTGDGNKTTANNPVVLYTYSMGDFTIAASLNDGSVARTAVKDDREYAIGLGYSFGDYSIGLGYEGINWAAPGLKTATQVTLGGSATFGTTTLNAYVASLRGAAGAPGAAGQATLYGLGVSSTFDALTVKGFVQSFDPKLAGVKTITAWGIGAEYDLGGGLSIAGGVVDDNGTILAPGAANSVKTRARADFGVKMKF